jgi:hypothetical protein
MEGKMRKFHLEFKPEEDNIYSMEDRSHEFGAANYDDDI